MSSPRWSSSSCKGEGQGRAGQGRAGEARVARSRQQGGQVAGQEDVSRLPGAFPATPPARCLLTWRPPGCISSSTFTSYTPPCGKSPNTRAGRRRESKAAGGGRWEGRRRGPASLLGPPRLKHENVLAAGRQGFHLLPAENLLGLASSRRSCWFALGHACCLLDEAVGRVGQRLKGGVEGQGGAGSAVTRWGAGAD